MGVLVIGCSDWGFRDYRVSGYGIFFCCALAMKGGSKGLGKQKRCKDRKVSTDKCYGFNMCYEVWGPSASARFWVDF